MDIAQKTVSKLPTLLSLTAVFTLAVILASSTSAWGAATPAANVSADPQNFSATVDETTVGKKGLVTATWTKSTTVGVTGYKFVVDASGNGKFSSVIVTDPDRTTAKICFIYNGQGAAYISITTAANSNPSFSDTGGGNPTSNWVLFDLPSITASDCNTANTTLYDYNITFNGNNSTSGSMSAQTGNDYGAVLSPNAFSRSGYTFNGWCSVQMNPGVACTGTSYTNEQVVSLSGNLTTTLYAQWTCNQSRILRYFANRATSGTLPVSGNQTVCQSESITLSANTGTLARTGFTWSGWSTSELGSGTNYAAGDPFTIPSKNTALYALWIPTNTKTQVVYNGNRADSGASPLVSEQTPGTVITIPGNTGNLVKAGKCFGGWNLKPNGSGTNYIENDPYTHTKTKKVVLYAKWSNC